MKEKLGAQLRESDIFGAGIIQPEQCSDVAAWRLFESSLKQSQYLVDAVCDETDVVGVQVRTKLME